METDFAEEVDGGLGLEVLVLTADVHPVTRSLLVVYDEPVTVLTLPTSVQQIYTTHSLLTLGTPPS